MRKFIQKIVVKKNKKNLYFWIGIASNGRTVCGSWEDFDSKRNCFDSAKAMANQCNVKTEIV